VTSYDALKAEIATKREQLSPRLQQLAEYALHNPNDMALETVAVIAERAKVPPSSLIRFARAFGYDGFTAMQRVFRSQLVATIPASYAQRIQALTETEKTAAPGVFLDYLAEAGVRALEHLREVVRPESLDLACDTLARADVIHVVGQRRAFAVAAYLGYALGQVNARVQLLDGIGGMMLQQADLIRSGDVLIAVSFAPYAPETLAVVHRADERKVPIITITDGPLSPLIPLSRVGFEVEDAQVQGFRSLPATMCLSLALVVGIGQRLADAAGPRRGGRNGRSRTPFDQPGEPGRMSGRPRLRAPDNEPV